MNPVIKVSNLCFSINQTNILNRITFEVPAGETIGIIGPNGSGKTTLFNCLSGFNYPDKGTIYFNDTEVTGKPPHERAALGMGRVFQNFGIFKEMTVMENLITALEAKQPLGKTFFPWMSQNLTNRQIAGSYLLEIGLDVKADQKAGSLSGGQMRLLEILRTLISGATCYLLDEPTAGVSPKMKEEVGEMIRKLQQLKQTVLIIEHDINFIQKFCDRIIVLNLGEIILDDTPEKVRNSKLLEEIYFGENSLEMRPAARMG